MQSARRFLTLIFFLILCPLLQARDSLLVVATASMIEDMAANIIGDLHRVKSIVPIGGDPHIYDPTPRAAKLAADADIIFLNGLTFEGWLNELIENSGTSAKIVRVTEGIRPIESLTYKNASDPHAWMVAANGIIYADNIRKTMQELDPENSDIYQSNFDRYAGQLRRLDTFIHREIAKIPEEHRILITSHDAFQYYGKAYGLRLESIIGVSTDAQAQTSDILRISRVLEESDIPAVFVESTINPKLLQQIAKDNNVSIGGELYSDSLGDEDSPASTYIDMLRHNTLTIVNALTTGKTVAANDNKSPQQENDSGGLPLWTWIIFGLLLVALLIFVLKRN